MKHGDVYSPAGIRETQISGYCEHCYDDLMRAVDDEDDDDDEEDYLDDDDEEDYLDDDDDEIHIGGLDCMMGD